MEIESRRLPQFRRLAGMYGYVWARAENAAQRAGRRSRDRNRVETKPAVFEQPLHHDPPFGDKEPGPLECRGITDERVLRRKRHDTQASGPRPDHQQSA